MTTHPILAFQLLLGADTRCRCADGPPWFRALLDERTEGPPPAVPIVWGRSLARFSVPDDATALIAVNCRDVSEQRLRDAGLSQLRRFAIVPSARHARWFIPLDSTSTAYAALSFYRPVRVASRVIHAALRTLAEYGLRFWYRDEVLIARRQLSPLEQLLESLFPHRGVRVAISACCPERGCSKLSLAILSSSGEVLAFAKSGTDGTGRRLVTHEAEVLQALAARGRLDGRVPRVLFAGEVDGSFVLVQSVLPGEAARAAIARKQRNFLALLRGGPLRAASETGFVRAIRVRAAALPDRHQHVRDVVDDLLPRLARLRVPATIVHGDFVPWNVRIQNGVASAFDWEYAHLDGLPLIDECNYMLVVGYLVHEWTIEEAWEHLREMARSAPLGFARSDVEALQLVHLVDLVSRFASEGAGDAPISKWFTHLMLRAAEQSRARDADLYLASVARHASERGMLR